MRTKQKHTPGPWEASGTKVYAQFGAEVADCEPFITQKSDATCKANARLVAAAPDLLAACTAVVAAWESGDLAEAARMCSEALKKAGEV